MKILYLIACDDEINIDLFKNKYNLLYEVNIIYTGIGKVNAAVLTTSALGNNEYDLVINIGTCGAISKDPCHGYLISKTRYIDVDVTGFGYNYGQIPKMPWYYESDQDILKIINNNKQYDLIVNGTADSFVCNNNQNQFYLDDIDCFDMELTAIAQACYIKNVPWISYKVISDNLLKSNSYNSYEQNLSIIKPKIEEFILYTYNLLKNL